MRKAVESGRRGEERRVGQGTNIERNEQGYYSMP